MKAKWVAVYVVTLLALGVAIYLVSYCGGY